MCVCVCVRGSVCLLANRVACVFHWIRCNHCIAMHGKRVRHDDITTRCPSPRQPVATGTPNGPTNGMTRYFSPFFFSKLSSRTDVILQRGRGDWGRMAPPIHPSPSVLFQRTLVRPNSAPWCLIFTTDASFFLFGTSSLPLFSFFCLE